jgi:hypothetical protein
MESTNWQALNEMECPRCGCGLLRSEIGYGCCSCNFKIRETKFNDIINSLYKPKGRVMRDDYEDNLSDLNNL